VRRIRRLNCCISYLFFFFSSRRRHTRFSRDWSSDVCSSDLSKATRLSFFLWNAPPDDELLAAAARGDLDTRAGLETQVERLLASERVREGVRAFFADML